MTLQHSKKRNVGLVYEFLTREVADAALKNDRRRAKHAMQTIDRHFSPGKPLHEELMVHRHAIESRGVSERLARSIVDQLKAASVRLAVDERARQAAKTRLIHEMNSRFGQRIFDRRVPDYPAHASIGIVLARGLGRLSEGIDAARVEDSLVRFLSSPAPSQSIQSDGNKFAYETAVRLYQEEFGKELTADQSDLIREYVRLQLGGRVEPFERTVERQRSMLLKELKGSRNDEVFAADQDMRQRLDESLAELERSPFGDKDTDELVERLMMMHDLLGEIRS